MSPPTYIGMSGASAWGGTAFTINSNTLTRIGDLLVVAVMAHTGGSVPATPTGWDYVNSVEVSGRVAMVYAKIAPGDGASSRNRFTMDMGAGVPFGKVVQNPAMLTYRSTAGGTVRVEAVSDSGVDAVSNLTHNVTGLDLGTLEVDDVVLTVNVLSTRLDDTSPPGSQALTSTGASFGSVAVRMSNYSNAAANTVFGGIQQYAVTSGGAGTLTEHFTGSGGSIGPGVGATVVLTLRESAASSIDEGLTGGAAPVIDLVSPPEGAIASTDDIVMTVTDTDGDLADFLPAFTFPTVGHTELPWTWAGGFLAPYTASEKTPITDGFQFTFRRDGGWVDTVLTFHGVAHDAAGNSATADYAWTTDYEGSYVCAPVGDPPVLTLVTPAEGSTIEPATAIVLDATDPDDDVQRIVIAAQFVNVGRTELVYDGADFRAPYKLTSTTTPITDGSEVSVQRDGGWPDTDVVLWVVVYDDQGHEVVATWPFVVYFAAVIGDDVVGGTVTSDGAGVARARDIEIDEITHDTVLTPTGDLSLVGGVPSVAQAIRQKLRSFYGEWFLDPAVGTPWFESVLVKAPALPAIRTLFREIIASVPGVLDVATLAVDFDRVARRLTVTFVATTDTGELVETIEIVGREDV